jgi:hypothetical protein
LAGTTTKNQHNHTTVPAQIWQELAPHYFLADCFGGSSNMVTRVKKACKFRCLPLSPAFNKAKLYHLRPKNLATKWRMDIYRDGYWKPHVSNSSALSVPKISKAVAASKKLIKDIE